MLIFRHPDQSTFGLLPEPEGRSGSFFTSIVINGLVLAVILYIGATAKRVMDEHKYEYTELIIPTIPPSPPPRIKVEAPPPPKDLPEPVKLPEPHFEPPKIRLPHPELKLDMKPITMEAKVDLPTVKSFNPAVTLSPQPKAALTAAMPAQSPQVKPSTAPVHLGETFGVTPNPNATRPATVAAIGNPYGGMQGPAVAPHGVVGSTGIGNGLKAGSNAGVVGKVASAGIPGGAGTSSTGSTYGNAKVASAGIPDVQVATAVVPQFPALARTGDVVEVFSTPPVKYTEEAKQLKIQGDVVLRVVFTANGQVFTKGVVHSLGHGLDDEAKRAVEGIHFRPANRDGKPIDEETLITFTFQLADGQPIDKSGSQGKKPQQPQRPGTEGGTPGVSSTDAQKPQS